jgi:ABC-2 type transport system permease protein
MTSTYALRDSTTMLRRDLRHVQRYPGLSLFPILMPVVFLLLFVYVFGDTLGNGITVGGGRGTYISFLTPGMLVFTVVGAAQIVAISAAKDMTDGIIARFKTMRIWRPAVFAGHVFSSLVLTPINLAITITVALLIGYHAAAGPLGWLAAVGVLVLLAVALFWLSGRSWPLRQERRDREQHTDVPHRPAVLRQRLRARRLDARRPTLRTLAATQPFTPITNTVRSLLANQHVGSAGFKAIVWCLGITAASYLWATHLYNRRPVH